MWAPICFVPFIAKWIIYQYQCYSLSESFYKNNKAKLLHDARCERVKIVLCGVHLTTVFIKKHFSVHVYGKCTCVHIYGKCAWLCMYVCIYIYIYIYNKHALLRIFVDSMSANIVYLLFRHVYYCPLRAIYIYLLIVGVYQMKSKWVYRCVCELEHRQF